MTILKKLSKSPCNQQLINQPLNFPPAKLTPKDLTISEINKSAPINQDRLLILQTIWIPQCFTSIKT
jgi:hypothetical protein